MSMYSDRKDHNEQERKNKNLADIGEKIRALPEHEQQAAMNILKNIGIDVYEFMHQSAPNRYDSYW